jgi:hypothetical protein
VVLTLLFVWVVDDSLEVSECGLCKQQKGADRGRGQWKGRKKKCLVRLIAVIVDSTAHPADLAEFLALFSSEDFKCGSICIDKCVVFVVVIVIIGPSRVGMKRGAI